MSKVYGNPATDGTGVERATAQSVEYGAFGFEFYAPKDDAELVALVGKDPRKVRDLLIDALKTDARGKAWADQKKAAQVEVQVGGKVVKGSGVLVAELQKLQAQVAALMAQQAKK
jgi:hypothetical protein